MRTEGRFALCFFAVLLLTVVVLAEDVCSRCREKIESPRWNFCPYCGLKLDRAPGEGAAAGTPNMRDLYESVSWDKIVLEKYKYDDKRVKFSSRFMGIQQYFAPAEILGITQANFINLLTQGNRTNYVDKKKIAVVEKVNRLRPYTAIVIYCTIKIRKDVHGMGQDVYIVIVDDIDVE